MSKADEPSGPPPQYTDTAPSFQPPPPASAPPPPAPVPMSQLIAPQAAGGGRSYIHETGNGTGEWKNPSQCCDPPMACCFYAPFPFCCAGCWMIRRGALQFDDTNRVVTVRKWTGHCHLLGCIKSVEVPYDSVGNFGYTHTSMSVGGSDHHQGTPVREVILVERDGTIHRLGHYKTDDSARQAAGEMQWYLFGRLSGQPKPSHLTSEFVNPTNIPSSGCCC
eukprot:m.431233 g.431233  ORF g.431233 m.431233 type:complete len:221 (+) comp17274_c0_seq1:3002-3664(+)